MERQRQKAMALEPTTSLGHNNPGGLQTASGASHLFSGSTKDKGAGRWFLPSSQRVLVFGIYTGGGDQVEEAGNHWHPWRNTAFQFIPHATPDMALLWLHPTPFPGSPHTWQHPCLAFAPAVLPALDAHLPSPNLHPSDPREFPKTPPCTVSLPLYAVHSKDLFAFTPPLPCSPRVPKSGRMGTTVGGRPARGEAGGGDWPHRVCCREQGMGMGGLRLL